VSQALAELSTPASAGPRQRLDSLDLLRGASILGILLMNVPSIGLPSAAYTNPTAYGNISTANYLTWIIIHIFADMKFITIFSTMFGAGIILQAERSAARGLSPAGVHYRRMAILLLIGLCHAYFVWFGDILVMYCLAGMILFPLRRLPETALIATGVCLISVATLIVYCNYRQIFQPVLSITDMSERIVSAVDGNDGELHAYRDGWSAEMAGRAPYSFDNETTSFALHWFWRCGGAMLIGMGLHKARFFHAAWPRPAYGAIAAFAIPAGAMITILGVLFNDYYGWNPADLDFPGMEFNYWGSLLSAFGYMALGNTVAIHAAQHAGGLIAAAVAPIRAVGKTALSNYIMQNLICTTIFYGHGFGEYGYISRIGCLEITLAIWAFQLFVSTLWLRRFNQGPLEWLWHKGVYFK
jgi:uncharacterized protein